MIKQYYAFVDVCVCDYRDVMIMQQYRCNWCFCCVLSEKRAVPVQAWWYLFRFGKFPSVCRFMHDSCAVFL